MKKNKTVKYYMEVCGNEFPLVPKMEITQKKFNELLENGIKLEIENKNNEFKVETTKNVYEKETFTATVIFITTSTTDLMLEKFECKEGYAFK